MIRSLLVGVLAVSALAACSGDTAAPVVKPGVAAGKVLEVSGTVTATRGATTRDLARGDEVSGDDTIKTGPDGRIAILLDHNRARWELGASKTAVVSGSLAWTAARQAGAGGASDEATLAAGRHAEKTGADTGATAAEVATPRAPEAARAESTQAAMPTVAPPAPESREDRAVVAPPAAQPPAPRRAVTAMAPRDSVEERKGAPGGLGLQGTGPGGGGTGTGTISLGTVRTGGRGAGAGLGAGAGGGQRNAIGSDDISGGGGAAPDRKPGKVAPPASAPAAGPPPPPPVVLPAPTPANVRAALGREHAAIARCLGEQASLAVEVVVTAGTLRFVLGAGAPAALPACLGAIAARLRFDPAAAPVTAPFTLTK